MSSYTTVEYYTNNYLMGREAVIDTASFPFYARKATRIIKNYTFGNVNELIDEVQLCCCELAELFYKEEKEGYDDKVQSEKKGEWSISYVAGKDAKALKQNEVRDIIYNWLAPTGLLYRGC